MSKCGGLLILVLPVMQIQKMNKAYINNQSHSLTSSSTLSLGAAYSIGVVEQRGVGGCE